MTQPRLLKLESCLADYTVKATISGITILKQNRFRKRYTGSKTHAVDINGKLWIDAKELKKLIDPAPQKKRAPSAKGAPYTDEVEHETTDFFYDLPTHEQEFLTNLPQLSTLQPVPEKKGYRIHKREVRQRLLAMIHSKAGKKELYFWTITFPQGTADAVAYQAFNTWLTTLRTKDKFGRRFLKNYLWVAERQKNNTVHFHIAIPHKMPVKYANGAMQTILKNLSEKSLLPFTKAQCKRYNGVDIAKNRNTKRVTNFAIKKGARALITYLTKYITKNDAEFSHLAWHNSRGFSALFTGLTFTSYEFNHKGERRITAEGEEIIVKWTHFLKKPPPLRNSRGDIVFGEDGKPISDFSAFEYEYFFFIPWDIMPPPSIVNHMAELNSYLQEVTAKN